MPHRAREEGADYRMNDLEMQERHLNRGRIASPHAENGNFNNPTAESRLKQSRNRRSQSLSKVESEAANWLDLVLTSKIVHPSSSNNRDIRRQAKLFDARNLSSGIGKERRPTLNEEALYKLELMHGNRPRSSAESEVV